MSLVIIASSRHWGKEHPRKTWMALWSPPPWFLNWTHVTAFTSVSLPLPFPPKLLPLWSRNWSLSFSCWQWLPIALKITPNACDLQCPLSSHSQTPWLKHLLSLFPELYSLWPPCWTSDDIDQVFTYLWMSIAPLGGLSSSGSLSVSYSSFKSPLQRHLPLLLSTTSSSFI